jgi:hypothetical protein
LVGVVYFIGKFYGGEIVSTIIKYVSFLGAFTKLRKATIRVFMPAYLPACLPACLSVFRPFICPSVRME